MQVGYYDKQNIGGSGGGTIIVYCTELFGNNSSIQANGGNSDKYYKAGEGAGGFIIIKFYKNFLS